MYPSTIYRRIRRPCWPICHERRRVYMGWLRFLGSSKLEISLAKEPCKRDDILHKRPISLRSLLIVATQYGDTRTFTIIGLFCKRAL